MRYCMKRLENANAWQMYCVVITEKIFYEKN